MVCFLAQLLYRGKTDHLPYVACKAVLQANPYICSDEKLEGNKFFTTLKLVSANCVHKIIYIYICFLVVI